jgi:transcriptional regulator with XRE-family HTH domain
MKKHKSKLNITGPLIRKLRKGNDWTQKEFAGLLREAGLKESTRRWVSKLESGQATLRDADLPYLFAVLGVSFSDAFVALISRASGAPTAEVKQSGASIVHLAGILPSMLLFAS